MKKRILSLIISAALLITSFAGCSKKADDVIIRVGSLSGPTTIGIVNLMKDSENEQSIGNYEFTVATQPDEIAAMINNGSIDIALVPANLASVLYNRTEGGISVLNINTLGVLYCISTDDSIASIEDLAGKTVITTGQGATPEYAMNYLLEQYGVSDCTLEFMADGSEVIASLEENPDQIAVLPQPAATAALTRSEDLMINFSLSDEWDNVTDSSRLVTGVTIVSNDFLENHPDAVNTFMQEQMASVDTANTDLEGTAELVVEQGIVGAAPIAQRAIPNCNIVCISGDDMKTALSGYLETLFNQNPQSVGGALPDDAFYYLG